MPVESKVKAGSLAAGVTALALWLLGSYVFQGAVPAPVAGVVEAVVPALVALAVGWWAPHTERPDLHNEVPLRDDA